MRYLLDTDHISFLQRRSSVEFSRLTLRMGQYSPDDFALSIVSLHEQVLGAHDFINRGQTNNDVVRGYTLLVEILQSFSSAPVLPFDAKASAIFEDLKKQKIKVSTMDLRIATIALSRNLILLTRNERDFGKVPGLVTENWTV
ncbi:type II toxin-antitoxin system VapC family toxin [Calothrix sp. 336/3]|uniref:type II toxin-antitoxin system VapC family toxin n=1 Tax=Calothrix sp. 336/3 TaxID=1337936 RepID=UPI0004E33932|nr:type II toxin-antitoxin system VapC family toxin [Calothrix sp. 336/3]AKG20578.1 PilT protein domain-containing protein [Calothrix sp. 336/3]